MSESENSSERKNIPPIFVVMILVWNNRPVRLDSLERLSLTDMWKACGAEQRNKPKEWLPNKSAKRLYSLLLQRGNSPLESATGLEPHHILEVIHGGPNAGTWACIELALAYAAYLDEQFWLWMYQSLADNRASKTAQALPFSAPALVPPVDLSPLMAKIDALTARVEALEAQLDACKLAEKIAPRVAENILPQVFEALSEMEQRLWHDAINGRYNLRHFMETQLAKPQSAAKPNPKRQQASGGSAADPARLRVETAGWASLASAVWKARGGKPGRARDFAALAPAGLFNAASDHGRAIQFAKAADKREGQSFGVQDGAIVVRFCVGTDTPRSYWLEVAP